RAEARLRALAGLPPLEENVSASAYPPTASAPSLRPASAPSHGAAVPQPHAPQADAAAPTLKQPVSWLSDSAKNR
ncbi:MAG: hypothetical protein RR951_10150, partial [Ruthenibacterium sp.]